MLEANKHTSLIFIITSLALLVSITITGYSQSTNQQSDKRLYRFIYSKDLFFNTKIEDAVALTKIFTEKIKKQKNVKENFEIVICETESELIEATKTNFDFVLSSTVDFIKLIKTGNVKPVLVNQTLGNFGYVYYLITLKAKGFNKLSDLHNRSIRILARNDGHAPSIWLEKLLRDKKLAMKNKFFKEISFDFVPTNVILPVFFKKLDAAIVTKASFELMCELNPNLLKEFNILEISPTLLFGVLCFDKKNKDIEREKFIYDILTTMHNDIDGQQFLNLFSLEKIIPYKEIYLTKFLELNN
jgi:ABC-type phosphate/phosphonate transport system substrate-binding protein